MNLLRDDANTVSLHNQESTFPNIETIRKQ